MYTVIINEEFIWSTFVSSILFCWSLMFPIAVIQRTSASTSFFIWNEKQINLSSKMYTPLQWCKATNNCFLCIYISSFTWKTTKHRKQYKKKGLKTSFFFSKLVEIRLKCVLMYQALWQIKTKEEEQKYMYTNLFFFPL